MPDLHSSPPHGDRRSQTGRVAAVASALAGAATALWVGHRARKAERLHPPPGKFIEVDGVRLHYLERGDGPPVVLLHGNGVQLEDFVASGLVDTLAPRHRVIAIDRPGFGHSLRPRARIWTPRAQAVLLRHVLEQLGVERPVIVGHSWGALVAIEMALLAPDDVSGLVLVSGYYYPTGRPDVWLNLPGATPVIGDVLSHTALPLAWRLTLNAAVRVMFAPVPVPPGFLQVVPREMILRPRQIRAASEDGLFVLPAVERLQDLYPRLAIPVTVVAGERDKIVDVEKQSARLHRELPHSVLIVAPDAGHMVHHGGSAAIADAVDAMTGSKLADQGAGWTSQYGSRS